MSDSTDQPPSQPDGSTDSSASQPRKPTEDATQYTYLRVRGVEGELRDNVGYLQQHHLPVPCQPLDKGDVVPKARGDAVAKEQGRLVRIVG